MTGDVMYKKIKYFMLRSSGLLAVIGKTHQLICMLGYSTITILGITSTLPYLEEVIFVEQAKCNTFPVGININSCYATPRNMAVPVIVLNTNATNV